MTGVKLRPAHHDESAALSDLALRSKGYWGYDAEFLTACRDELTVQAEQCDGVHLIVAEEAGVLAGYYLLTGEPPDGELADLFVDPLVIGHGIGGALLRHARSNAAELGYHTLVIEADPYAEPFYANAGARRIGETPSGSIPGRTLPKLELLVSATS